MLLFRILFLLLAMKPIFPNFSMCCILRFEKNLTFHIAHFKIPYSYIKTLSVND